MFTRQEFISYNSKCLKCYPSNTKQCCNGSVPYNGFQIQIKKASLSCPSSSFPMYNTVCLVQKSVNCLPAEVYSQTINTSWRPDLLRWGSSQAQSYFELFYQRNTYLCLNLHQRPFLDKYWSNTLAHKYLYKKTVGDQIWVVPKRKKVLSSWKTGKKFIVRKWSHLEIISTALISVQMG